MILSFWFFRNQVQLDWSNDNRVETLHQKLETNLFHVLVVSIILEAWKNSISFFNVIWHGWRSEFGIRLGAIQEIPLSEKHRHNFNIICILWSWWTSMQHSSLDLQLRGGHLSLLLQNIRSIELLYKSVSCFTGNHGSANWSRITAVVKIDRIIIIIKWGHCCGIFLCKGDSETEAGEASLECLASMERITEAKFDFS